MGGLPVVGQDNPQAAIPDMTGDVPFRPQHDSMAAENPVQRDFAVVRAQVAAYLRGLHFPVSVVEPPYVVSSVVLAQNDAIVPLEVSKRCRGPVIGKIGW